MGLQEFFLIFDCKYSHYINDGFSCTDWSWCASVLVCDEFAVEAKALLAFEKSIEGVGVAFDCWKLYVLYDYDDQQNSYE